MTDVVAGIDIGGSSIKMLLVQADSRAEVVSSERWPLDGDAGVAEAVRTVSQFCGPAGASAVGISVPGVVDHTEQRVVRSANLPWLEDPGLVPRLQAALKCPVRLANDGVALATAEARVGAGAGSDDVLVLALGTGIAGAHVVDGAVRNGAHDGAGELGHVVVDPGGAACSCGQHGCLETLLGAPHLLRRWRERGGPDAAGVNGFAAAARAGDAAATEVTDAAMDALARVLLTAVALIDPGMIVVGGGLAQSSDVFVAPAAARLGELATFHRVPPVRTAALGAWAGAHGAALLAHTDRD